MNQDGYNAQNLNAKNMLPYFSQCIDTTTVHTGPIDERLTKLGKSVRLREGRLYSIQMIFRYLFSYDAIFYPGHQRFDAWGLKLRKLIRGDTPIISTLEGIPWMHSEKKDELEKFTGHEIHCMSFEASKYYIQVLALADHVIAISPFLAAIGKHLFGDKFSVIPLGIDPAIFYYDESVAKNERVTVVSSGTVYARKRPELFIDLAKRHPGVNFVWYGGGELLEKMRQRAEKECHSNIEFAGLVNHNQLAEGFRKADLFVLPSLSEGVPKVSQEAAACGLPLILFGYYEAPTVVHGKNGYVVWNNEEFFQSVASLICDREMMSQMGQESVEMAKQWNWDQVAKQWETELFHILSRLN